MTAYKYPPRANVFASSGNAFNEDSPNPDSLVVGVGAFLDSSSGIDVELGAMGAWTVIINGSVIGSTAIDLAAGNTGLSKLTIGRTGEVGGGPFNNIVASSPISVKNAGFIDCEGPGRGILLINSGTNIIVNTGTISGGSGSIGSAGSSDDRVTNSGHLLGLVTLGGGDDTFTDFRTIGHKVVFGQTNSSIDLGAGTDKFLGGSFAETVRDADGADTYKLGGGNDTYIASGNTGTDGIDHVDGGTGKGDLYDASGAPSTVLINLDKIDHDFFGTVSAQSARGTDISGTTIDKITGFENASGGADTDVIFGSGAANMLNGNGGSDFLFGLAGNDQLSGGDGADTLHGGKGRDVLSGGPGDGDFDNFVFDSISDSTVAKSGRDVITDFEQAHDRIDVSAIDAITTNAKNTNDPFTFIGTNVDFSHHAGELRAVWTAAGQLVQGDVNGDGKPDFAIELTGILGHVALTTGNFFL